MVGYNAEVRLSDEAQPHLEIQKKFNYKVASELRARPARLDTNNIQNHASAKNGSVRIRQRAVGFLRSFASKIATP